MEESNSILIANNEKELKEFHLNREIAFIQETNVVDYKVNSSALKWGIACHVCGGIKGRPFYGEEICSCEKTEQDNNWLKRRQELALYISAQISYDCAFVCEDCHKLNRLFGQTEETANTCNYCGHKQKPE